MPDLNRPEQTGYEPVDAEALDRAALSALKVGSQVTNINGTSSVWKVVRPGVMKRVSVGEASDA